MDTKKSPCHDADITPKGTCGVCGKTVEGAEVSAGGSSVAAGAGQSAAPANVEKGPVLKKYKVLEEDGWERADASVVAKGEVVELDPESEEAKLALDGASIAEVEPGE